MRRSIVTVLSVLGVLGLLGILGSRFGERAASERSLPTCSESDLTVQRGAQNASRSFAVDSRSVEMLAATDPAICDPARAAALIAHLPDSDRQHDLALQFLQQLFAQNPALAADFVRRSPPPLDWQMGSALASMWGEKDTHKAVEWARNLPRGPVRTQALMSLCADWGSVDPQAAAEFVMNAEETDFPIASLDPVAGNELEVSSRIRNQILEIIGHRWADKDREAAIGWTESVPTGTARDSFLAGIGSAVAAVDAARAADLVASMNPGWKQEDAALTVLLEWGRDNLVDAGDWLNLFSPGEFRERALLNLVGNALHQSSADAKMFVLAWPEPEERSHAIHHYLNEILAIDAAQGTNLLASIEDASSRREETERLVQHWMGQDRAAASAWISENAE